MTCPECHARIGWNIASAREFLCPKCHQGLVLRKAYFRVVIVVSQIVAGLLAYGFGLRRDNLIWGVLVGMFPVYIILINITTTLFPPDLELTGEFRGILYSDQDDGPHDGKTSD